ncbi:MAG: alpha/beta fold hydrolase, partial [Proteobacteria bacterium]|nr:alpha/beta fold hydrolase [Pseudomonadota bacterium]
LLMCLLFALPVSAAERVARGSVVMENIPPVPDTVFDQLRRYAAVRTASLRDWQPSGGLLISTRFGNTGQLHEVDAPLAMRRQLTFFSEPVSGGDYPPAGSWNGFLFQKDVGGNEQNQIFWFDKAEGKERLLTDGVSRNSAPTWSHDGKQFVYSSNREDGTNMDIWIGTPEGPESARLVRKVEGSWFPMDFSPDGRHVLAMRYVSINEAHVYEVDVESGEAHEMRALDETVGYRGGAYGRKGKYIYFISDEGSEFQRLHRLDRKTREVETLTKDINWDVVSLELSGDGNKLAYAVNEAGIERLHVRDLRNNRDTVIDALPDGTLDGFLFSPDDKQLAITVSAADSPSDVYVYNLQKRDLSRWTQSEVGGLDPERFVAPELVSYPTFDKVDGKPRQLPAFVYKPRNDAKRHPVVVYIHGGPESQFQPHFFPNLQYLIDELGVAVVAPNVRGSAGYGKSSLKLDNGFLREDSVKDIGALLDWIATRDDLDEDRVIVYGRSYGGYMVLASMVHFDERLLGGIDVVGISNFVTFLQNTQDYRRDLRRAEYGDERDSEMHAFLQRTAPNNRADEITSPLLVVQGANDPRVPLSESEQMVATIRENGGEVWYFMAKDEGHSFRKKETVELYLASVSMFIRHLLEESR